MAHTTFQMHIKTWFCRLFHDEPVHQRSIMQKRLKEVDLCFQCIKTNRTIDISPMMSHKRNRTGPAHTWNTVSFLSLQNKSSSIWTEQVQQIPTRFCSSICHFSILRYLYSRGTMCKGHEKLLRLFLDSFLHTSRITITVDSCLATAASWASLQNPVGFMAKAAEAQLEVIWQRKTIKSVISAALMFKAQREAEPSETSDIHEAPSAFQGLSLPSRSGKETLSWTEYRGGPKTRGSREKESGAGETSSAHSPHQLNVSKRWTTKRICSQQHFENV